MRLDRSSVVNLLLLALALGTALVLVLTRAQPTQDELDARARNLVPEFQPGKLVKLTISSEGKALELRSESSGDAGARRYRLGSGQEAEPEAVRLLLGAIELSAFLKKLDPKEADRAALGLDTPRARLVIELESGRGEVLIGKQALTPKDTTYVEVRGFGRSEPRLGLVRSSAVSELLASEDTLRHRWLTPYSASDIVGLTVKAGSAPALELERGDGPAFRVKGGARVPRTATDRFLLELARTRADRALPDPGPAFADGATLRAELVPSEQRPRAVLELGNECPGERGRFALRRISPEPGAFCVDSGLKAALHELALHPIDDAAFTLHTDEVESLSLERGGKRIELRRKEQGFELVSDSGRAPVELTAGNRWLDEVLAVRGQVNAGADQKALGLEPPAASITLRSSAIERTPKFEESVLIGSARADGGLALARRYDGVVLSVGREAAQALSGDTSALRARRLLDFGPSDLRSLSITAGGQRQRLKRTEAGVFELTEPSGFNHDSSATLSLIQALGTLEADRWVRESEHANFGLAEPRVRVEAELVKDGKPTSFRLDVGAETTGGYFARLDTTSGVFVLPKPLVYDLGTLLLARDIFIVDPSRLTALTLRVGQRRIALERQTDGFRSAPGTPELAQPLIERIVALATSLRAEAAIHTGAARPDEGLAQPELELELRVATPAPETITIRIGAEQSLRGAPVRVARRSDLDATYAIPSASVRELAEAL